MNRNKIKANGLKTLSEMILIAATLTAGVAVHDLFKPVGDAFAAVGCIVIAFGAHSILAPILTDVFGRLIHRITPAPAADVDTSESKANA